MINAVEISPTYPTGYVKIFKNCAPRDTTDWTNSMLCQATEAPFRVGTRDRSSFLKGPIGKVAIYLHELTPERITSHYEAMVG